MNQPRPEHELDLFGAQLAEVLGADRADLRRRVAGLQRRARKGQPIERGLAELRTAIAASVDAVSRRRASLPRPEYPPELPVVQRREELARAIADNQVLIVCGATGSGKSTQLPKICMEIGRGARGLIAHTQPRRLAARTLAARIAEELKTEIGAAVGYKIRFTEEVGPQTALKLLTDGMLLAEIQTDRLLDAYDTIIIDEAHERSLNIDFLLGYLKQLLPRRPDLRLIITSATIDPQRFAEHFADAPIIEVSGRSYPVELRYRPLIEETGRQRERDQRTAVLEAVDELVAAGPGDVLVFLAGEREIRETAEALRKHHPEHTEILPLYARLSSGEQTRVFKPGGRRRIVLATNVAETSVTVPGIRYVVDAGFARISRYSYRTKVQRLPIEPISQASANQRAGRCGRLSAGICIRLYAESDYNTRPEYTEPEIQRTNLAAVILQMKALSLGEVEDFPFIDPPDSRFVNDGYKLLLELGAVENQRELTPLGRRLARLPVDPRIARILLQGERENCLNEMLVIAAALSIQDPRERPLEAQQAADQAQREFKDERSDFMAYLKLWAAYQEQARHLSQRKLQGWCREHFLAPSRMREWGDIQRQLKQLVTTMGLRANPDPAEPVPVHRALLSGFLGNIALRGEGSEYIGPRNIRLFIFPGSGTFKTRPKWIMAAEFVETQRLFARDVAEIRPEWVEALAGHLLSRSYAEPHWEARPAQVAAFETVSLYGLVLCARRKINFGPIDPARAREIFLREALVRGELRSRGEFLAHNRALIDEVEGLEAKSRRRDLLVDEEALHAFYDARVPAGVYSGATFERWRQSAEREHPQLLFMRREDLMQRSASELSDADFPDHFSVQGMQLPVEYHFEPGDPLDGATVVVPLPALNQLDPAPFSWLVPGLRRDKVIALIKALPKALRRNFVPAPDFAAAVLQAADGGEGTLEETVRRELRRMSGVEIPIDAWDAVELDAHLRMSFKVIDAGGKVLGSGKALQDVRDQLSGRASRQFEQARPNQWQREGLRSWDFGDLPESVEFSQSGVRLRGYPALVDEQASVRLCLADSPAQAAGLTRAGLRRLFMLSLPQQTKYLRRNLPHLNQMCLYFRKVGSCEDLQSDIVAAAVERALRSGGELPRSEAAFRAALESGRGGLIDTANELCQKANAALELFQLITKKLQAPVALAQVESLGDIQEQLGQLIYVGFVSETPAAWFEHLPRYLQAIVRRLDKMAADPGRDGAMLRTVRPFWQQYLERAEQHKKKSIADPALTEFRWLLEEFRVSLFAQELRTVVAVSEKRLRQQWQGVT